jgi:glycosyltransferase involved in cell wall biosynthesis
MPISSEPGPLFRLIERRFDISHVYTSLGDWHFLNALGRRPIVLTLTQHGVPASAKLLTKVSRVVAETERLADAAIAHGVPPERVSVIHPGVDLDLFVPRLAPALPWKCVFASSPENVSEIKTKGVDLLIETARCLPGVEFTILWRPFGKAADIALDQVQASAPANVRIVKQRVPDMHRFLSGFHFAIAPFRTVGKPCPNSILESLALARPVVVSDFVDIGPLLEREGAGRVFQGTPESCAAAIMKLCDDYDAYQQRARPCAELHFDFRKTSEAYLKIYQSLL